MSSLRMYDVNTDYQVLKVKIISELIKIEDRIAKSNTGSYGILKSELEDELKAINHIISNYYY